MDKTYDTAILFYNEQIFLELAIARHLHHDKITPLTKIAPVQLQITPPTQPPANPVATCPTQTLANPIATCPTQAPANPVATCTTQTLANPLATCPTQTPANPVATCPITANPWF